jgi:RNA polymerase sigma factor (TIGR02999 family)
MQSLRVDTSKGMLGAERTTIVRATLATRTHQDMPRPIPLADAGATSDPAVGEDERQSLDALFPLVYEELRRIAHRRLRGGARGQTLNTTALVHEAYLRLAERTGPAVIDRAHFCALASRAMRFVLVDYARTRTAQKRGGGESDVSVDDVQIAADERAFDLLALDETLEQLKAHDGRLAQLVEYRFFGGLSYDEIAEVTGLSVPTVKRDWRRARSWLYVHVASDA